MDVMFLSKEDDNALHHTASVHVFFQNCVVQTCACAQNNVILLREVRVHLIQPRPWS
jgi:hypothetical protein